MFESHASNSESFSQRGIVGQVSHEATETYPDMGYETEIGIPLDHSGLTSHNSLYNTDTYMYTTAKDEFMGQLYDIDEIGYSNANQIEPQIVRRKKQLAVPCTVLIHEQSGVIKYLKWYTKCMV